MKTNAASKTPPPMWYAEHILTKELNRRGLLPLPGRACIRRLAGLDCLDAPSGSGPASSGIFCECRRHSFLQRDCSLWADRSGKPALLACKIPRVTDLLQREILRICAKLDLAYTVNKEASRLDEREPHLVFFVPRE